MSQHLTHTGTREWQTMETLRISICFGIGFCTVLGHATQLVQARERLSLSDPHRTVVSNKGRRNLLLFNIRDRYIMIHGSPVYLRKIKGKTLIKVHETAVVPFLLNVRIVHLSCLTV